MTPISMQRAWHRAQGTGGPCANSASHPHGHQAGRVDQKAQHLHFPHTALMWASKNIWSPQPPGLCSHRGTRRPWALLLREISSFYRQQTDQSP